jgi:hypothetical protein
LAPDQRLNSALTFERKRHRDQASTLCSQYHLQSKLIISQSLLIALSKLIVNLAGADWDASEISLSRNYSLIKPFMTSIPELP